MKTFSSVAVLALAFFAVAGGSAEAQQFGPRIPQYGVGFRPGLSPYLNLLRGGDTSANYYLGVRPEIQRRADRSDLYSRTRDLENRTSEIEGENEELAVGTPSDFGDTRNYFASPNTYFQKVGPITSNQLTRPLGRPRSR